VRVEAQGPVPDLRTILGDLAGLLARGWRTIDAELYRYPYRGVGPAETLKRTRDFLRDLDSVNARRRERRGQDVFHDDLGDDLPRYFRQNFHFQTDGYLSDESARLYEHQVEVLFGGGADAMRRQALAHLAPRIKEMCAEGRPIRSLRLLDVACGAGGFLAEVKHNFPRLPVAGIDLSPNYAAEAERRLARWSWKEVSPCMADSLPFPDASFDALSCVFLFHELPTKVRRQAAGELARVLKPHGVVAFVDSIQLGDFAPYDGLLRRFPEAFHEPYYADYVASDLEGLFADAGLALRHCERAYFSKVMVLEPAHA